jgi:hypothetical protein
MDLNAQGIGGSGFHECMNFMLGSEDRVRIYIPPTALPSQEKVDDEFVIFWFTYKQDQEQPSRIIGVHGGVSFDSIDEGGLVRRGMEHLAGYEKWLYHATAPEDLTTLITPTLQFELHEQRYTPKLRAWGNGQRYLTQENACNILSDAFAAASARIPHANESEHQVLLHEIEVLRRLVDRYDLNVPSIRRVNPRAKMSRWWALPDKELGELGEKIAYERELSYAESIGADPSSVEWTSRQAPHSPFDIKTIRLTKDGLRDHFIEVKSSAAPKLGENVYVSSYQLDHFESVGDRGTFVFVRFNDNRTPTIDELTLAEVREKFSLSPIKYRLVLQKD